MMYNENKEFKPAQLPQGCLPGIGRALAILIVLIIMSAVMTSCKTVYVPVESVRTEYRDRLRTDSIHVLDSVHIREKGDTVWLTRWRTEYRDRLRVDSVFICDSIQVPYRVEVVKQLSWWDRLKIETGGILLGMLAVVLVYVIVKVVKTVKSVGWF